VVVVVGFGGVVLRDGGWWGFLVEDVVGMPWARRRGDDDFGGAADLVWWLPMVMVKVTGR
jgi:hypothetical protein